MGLLFSRMFSSVFGNKEARILVLGLDNAGKTTILYRLQMGEVVSTIPRRIQFVVDSRSNWTEQLDSMSRRFSITISNSKSGIWVDKQVSVLDKKWRIPITALYAVFKRTVLRQENALSLKPLRFPWESSHVGSALTHMLQPYWRCYFPNTQAIIYVVDSSDTDRLVIAKEEFHAILEEEELRGAVVLIFANKQDLPGALDDAAITEALELHKIKNRQWAIFKTSALKGEGLFEGLDW
ncbi:Small GTPase superfamily, ARF type [Trema orientale]|uniref:Small GTPase superfamily, ARF type n=1 Tax=Trema orientale TaxID=63057 RepID=A0A2P5FJL6_TREOI|nr:Small GTPase superfamily, ARF type [Trema orientale]